MLLVFVCYPVIAEHCSQKILNRVVSLCVYSSSARSKTDRHFDKKRAQHTQRNLSDVLLLIGLGGGGLTGNKLLGDQWTPAKFILVSLWCEIFLTGTP